MVEFSIESNGLLKKTAIYYNGQTIQGIKEIYMNISEDGDFDAILKYMGDDELEYSKHIFEDSLTSIKLGDPVFTEAEAEDLTLLTIKSDGNLENTEVLIDDEFEDGIVELFLHIKTAQREEQGFFDKLMKKEEKKIDNSEFRAEITYRNDDDSIETERIF